MTDNGLVDVTTIDIRGTKFNIQVDTNGTFYAKAWGTMQRDSSLEDLRKKLSVKVSQHKAKISVHFMILAPYQRTDPDTHERGMGYRFEECAITGMHGGNGNWLIHNRTTGEREQDSYRHYSTGYRVLTAEEQAEALRLNQAVQDADKAWREWSSKHSYDPRNDASRAMKEAREQAQA